MKYVLGIASVLCLVGISAAQCQIPSQSGPSQSSGTFNQDFGRSGVSFVPSAPVRLDRDDVQGRQTELTAEARDFIKTGPVVFKSMDEATRVAKATGRQVACWVSEDGNPLAIFNNAEVRKVSAALDKDTVQVAMGKNPTRDRKDRDGKPLTARVEFSSNLYDKSAPVAYIPVSKLTEDDTTKILKFIRSAPEK